MFRLATNKDMNVFSVPKWIFTEDHQWGLK